MSEQLAPSVFVLDMDRTLINSDWAVQLYGLACKKEGLNITNELRHAQAETESTAGSFAARKDLAVRADVTSELLARVDEQFISICQEYDNRDMLVFPDTDLFLHKLGRLAIPHLILTQGDDPKWQKLKLKAAGLNRIPHVITGLTDAAGIPITKGSIIASWTDSQTGVVEPQGVVPAAAEATLRASKAVLLDDKGPSFIGLPQQDDAFWVQRGVLRPSQQIPAGTTHETIVINSLADIDLLEYAAA